MLQKRQLAAVMFTDIVGFTFLMGQDESHGLGVLEKNRRIHEECLAAFDGHLIKEMGDGMFVWFADPRSAIHCAVMTQERIAKEEFQLRIGIHLGDVVFREGDVFGNTVNIANRVEGLANPGAVFVTEEVVEAIQESSEFHFAFLGEHALKNVEAKVRIFGLEHPSIAEPKLALFLDDSIDQDIQQYHLLEKLAVGGMGVIYKALDTRLQRPVALKFLSYQLHKDEAARERFLQEARAVAALQHPNICTIHEIEETKEGRFFIAMELIEGPTLSELVNENGPLPPERALDLSIQLAEGLAHAHQAGIIHRDIKADNILITPDGTLKILDFGLALTRNFNKARRGTRVGTIAYMSPEQARGDQVDHRTDIWSFGVVLYEMLTGRLPFKSEYTHTLINTILHDAPDPLSGGERPLPGTFHDILSRCLEKEPSYRVQTAGDLLATLRRLKRDWSQKAIWAEDNPSASSRRETGRSWWWLAAVLLAVAVGWQATAYFNSDPTPEEALGYNMKMNLFTGVSDLSLAPAWSPDGEWILYISSEEGHMDIWKKPVSGGPAQRMTAWPGNEVEPAWSPDGHSIAFRADLRGGGIYIIPADGGTPYPLTDFGGSPAWSPDSRELAFSAYGNVYVIAANGGAARLLVEGTSANPRPIWSADGERILFWNRRMGDVQVVRLSDGATTSLSFVPAGQEVSSLSLNQRGDRLLVSMGPFGGNKDLFEVPIDTLSSLRKDNPVSLTVTPTDDIGGVYSPDGRHIAFTARTVVRHLYSMPLDPRTGLSAGEPQQLTLQGKMNYYPSLSGDGQMLVWTSHRSGQGNLYCSALQEGDIRKVTPDWDPGIREISGRFGPSGEQVVFASTRGGSYQLWRVPSIGSVGLQLTETNNPERDLHPSVSPAGDAVAFYSNRSESWDIWRLDLGTDQKLRPLTDWPGNELYPEWSPDGRELAFVTDRDGNADIWKMAADGSNPTPFIVSPAAEHWCAWSPDQRWFFFVSDRSGSYNIWRVPAEGGEAEAVTTFNDPAFGLPENSIYTKFAAAADRLILSLESRKGDIYLLEMEEE